MLSQHGNRGQCLSTLPDTFQNIQNNTNNHIFSHRPTVCVGVLGLLVVVFSMCHRNFTRFPTGTWVSQITKTVSQNCVKSSLCFQSAAKQRVDIRFCHEFSRAQHNRTNENDETLNTCVKRACGKCVCGLKNLHMTSEKYVARSKRFTREENSTHVECTS